MPELLKNYFNLDFVNRLAAACHKILPDFDSQRFTGDVLDAGWEPLELKQRMRHITHMLHRHLPADFSVQAEVLRKVAPAFSGLPALVFPDFVEVYGLEHPEISLPVLEELTQYSSAEFAVRPFFLRYPERMQAQHLAWAKHTSYHVRRLASEGMRPRLPWAMALPVYKKDPAPIFPVLELLKTDDSEYVRRSVANNLNDISKDHPLLVLETIEKWKGISTETDRIIKHASRTLLKKGHNSALGVFGFNPEARVAVTQLQAHTPLAIGDTLTFSFAVTLQESSAQPLRIEYAVWFVKSGGKTSRKIFQVKEAVFVPGKTILFSKKHRFTDFTTRKHYPGTHLLEIVVNGSSHAQVEVELR